jgi:hypothetical protein
MDNVPAPNAPARSPGYRGALAFDVAVLCANLLVVAPLTDLVRTTRGFHPLFGGLLIAAVVLHTLGAGLKRRPLQTRLAAGVRPPASGGRYLALLILFVMHYGLFCACLMMALSIFEDAQLVPKLSDLALAGAMVGALCPTVLTLWALLPFREKPAEDARRLRHREYAADAALYASALIILAWWDGVFVEMLAGAAKGHWLMSIVLVLLTTVPFAMFYLAPRMLFLAEDYRDPKAWGRILLVALSLAKRLVIG